MKPLLQLMERHPLTDLGMPGPIVHYVETFYYNNVDEYLSILIDSIRCHPSLHTIWMLNRVKNVVQDKSIIFSVFQDIVDNLSVEQEIRDLAKELKFNLSQSKGGK